MTDPVFTTSTAADSWEDGLVVGSGRVGAVVHGPADAISISLAHERYFLPVNARPDAPDLTPVREELRSALLDGDADAASRALSRGARAAGYDDGLIWTDPLGLCATLTIRTPGGVAESRRVIDPLGAEVAVEWTDLEDRRHAVRLIAPYGGESVLVALEADCRLPSSSSSDWVPAAPRPWTPGFPTVLPPSRRGSAAEITASSMPMLATARRQYRPL